jgi:hypothetical protein
VDTNGNSEKLHALLSVLNAKPENGISKMLVEFDKNGQTLNCPNNLGNETQSCVCESCRHYGGSYGFRVTCFRNERFVENYEVAINGK